MIKRFALLATLLLAGCLTAVPAAAAALLRSHVVVVGPVVTLGDLFDNAGDRASVPVLRAPPPGQRITVDTDWLTHVALVNNVQWHPRDLFDEAVIERTGITIGREQIVDSLMAALEERGAPADSTLELESQGRNQQLVIPADVPPNLTVHDLFYDHAGNRFSATVTVGDAKILVAGRLFPTVEVPVLNHPTARGDLITAQDIAMIRMREDQLRPAMITDPGAIVGMSSRIALRAGLPVASADLQRPLAVTRGALVTLVLSANGMSLTAQGRSLDQGALGDTVRVTNTHSNLTVEGTVEGANRVRVSLTGGPVALAN